MASNIRIALAQVFTQKKALTMLSDLAQRGGLDVILLPALSFEITGFCDLLAASEKLPTTTIITSMIIPEVKNSPPLRHHRALKCLKGVGSPVYNNFTTQFSEVESDLTEENFLKFRSQPKNCFVSIFNDYIRVGQMNILPKVWFIPARESDCRDGIIPPIGFHGVIVFCNGSPLASRTSYFQHFQTPYSPDEVSSPIENDIPMGHEECLIFDANTH